MVLPESASGKHTYTPGWGKIYRKTLYGIITNNTMDLAIAAKPFGPVVHSCFASGVFHKVWKRDGIFCNKNAGWNKFGAIHFHPSRPGNAKLSLPRIRPYAPIALFGAVVSFGNRFTIFDSRGLVSARKGQLLRILYGKMGRPIGRRK